MILANTKHLLLGWSLVVALVACAGTARLRTANERQFTQMETTGTDSGSREVDAPAGARRTEAEGAAWVRAGQNTNLPIWGIRGGLLWGLPPATGQPTDGPRGLIRLRYPTLTHAGYDLVNFIAIEPVVRGQKGFSELERSRLDGVPGKRLWTLNANASAATHTDLNPGLLTRLDSDVEILAVRVGVERFENGAHVSLTLVQSSDTPDELELTISAEPDSAPLEYCILTATMGNKARARRLWLKDKVMSSLKLYPNYREPDFAPHRLYPLDHLHRTMAGDVLVAITTDEADPSRVEPFPGRAHWRYAGFPVTQYWRKPAGSWRDDLHVAVNGRYTYWRSRQAIPGGIAFENFELREHFHPGQRFVFGITRRTPPELGFDPALLASLSSSKVPAAQRTFNVRDFGALPDSQNDTGEPIRAAIQAAVNAGPGGEVVLEEGTYRVKPKVPRGACFPIRSATNLVLRGAGKSTKIVITDPAAGGFTFGLGRRVTLRDLTIDYDPVPFCQGTVRAVDVEAGSFDLEVEVGYPTPDADNFVKALEPYGKWGMIIDPATRRIRSGTPDHYMTPRWEHRENRVWRFFAADEYHRRNLAHMRVGDSYVHLARGYGSAVLAQGCAHVRIEKVNVHASPGLAVGLVGNRGDIVVRGLEVRFAPGTTRLLTTNADGVHGQQNRTGPHIEECYFEGMADDAINFYAPPNVLLDVRSPTKWLVSPGCVVLPGDRLQVLDPKSGRVRGQVKVAEVKAERGALLLTLDQALEGVVAGADHRAADTLYNLDACGAGFLIRRNHMNGNRRYACLLRAGDGVVEDNTFEDTTGAGVVLTNEPDWPEGPVPWGITIRRNRFLRGGTCLGYADSPHGAALTVRATRLGHGLANAEAIRDVTIEDNEFQDRPGVAMFVGGATSVTVRNNRIQSAVGAELRRGGPTILLERSSGVVLSDNTVTDPRAGITTAVEIGPDVAPGDSGVRISGLNASLASGVEPVVDRRAGR